MVLDCLRFVPPGGNQLALKLKPAIRIKSVSAFVEHVMDWTRSEQRPVAFRGQSYHGWRTEPRLFRSGVGLYEHEKNAVRDIVSVHPQEFQHDQTMFDRLVRMQHFELPTRLLDVTTNPLVALYFATAEHRDEDGDTQDGKVQALFLPEDRQRYYDSDRVSCMANLANLTYKEKQALGRAYKLPPEKFNSDPAVERLLWFVRQEKSAFTPDIIPLDLQLPVFVKPKMSNRRIIAQSGAFIIYGSRRTSNPDTDLRLQRVLIPAENKADIREQLGRLGVNESVLFPEIDKAASYIVKRYSSIV